MHTAGSCIFLIKLNAKKMCESFAKLQKKLSNDT